MWRRVVGAPFYTLDAREGKDRHTVAGLARGAVAVHTIDAVMMWHWVAIGAASGGLVVGVVGFVLGAGVADERAGEAATWLGLVGLGVGAALGAGLGALLHALLR